MNKQLFASLLAATLLVPTAWAQTCSTWSTAERFTLSGDEVTDKRTGLTWKRCSEGQSWSGSTCTGTVTALTHEEALMLAKTANSSQSATGWRLPNVKELASLADKGCLSPAIDPAAFPATPSVKFWSSSPYVGNPSRAWFVNFIDGFVGDFNENLSRLNVDHRVRLVRSNQ